MISPVFLLNHVARLLEVFAVVSYERLAEMYPEHRELLLSMAQTEKEHEEYFKKV
jgi:rubrerythrin